MITSFLLRRFLKAQRDAFRKRLSTGVCNSLNPSARMGPEKLFN